MAEIKFLSLEIKTKLITKGEMKISILSFIGQINQDNAYFLSEDLSIFFPYDTFNTILDISALTYVNSIGLAFLLSLFEKVDQNSSKICIGAINPKIEIIIQLLDLDNKHEIFSSTNQAIDSF